MEEAIIRLETNTNEAMNVMLTAVQSIGVSEGIARIGGSALRVDSAGQPVGTAIRTTTGHTGGSVSRVDSAGQPVGTAIHTTAGSDASQPVQQIVLSIDVNTPEETLNINRSIDERLRLAGVTRDQVVAGPEITYDGPGGLGTDIKNMQDIKSIDVPGTFRVRFNVKAPISQPPVIHASEIFNLSGAMPSGYNTASTGRHSIQWKTERVQHNELTTRQRKNVIKHVEKVVAKHNNMYTDDVQVKLWQGSLLVTIGRSRGRPPDNDAKRYRDGGGCCSRY